MGDICNAIGVMGILDDAIREHLELKRRLGAPEEEVQQKETEAFGAGGAVVPAAGAEPSFDPAATEEEPEFQVQRASPAEVEEPSSTEDVLQETPEFLEETPEHDRLWFEQRPPKDFDLD